MFAFLWLASRCYRLRPWASPYLRWRIETYSGIPAEQVDRKLFFRFVWQERAALFHYLVWVKQNRHLLKQP